MATRLSLCAFLAFFLTGCSTEHHTSRPTDVAADGKMAWVADNILHIGQCPPNVEPSRKNCPSIVEQPYADFQDRVDYYFSNKIETLKSARHELITKARESSPEVRSVTKKLQDTKKAIETLPETIRQEEGHLRKSDERRQECFTRVEEIEAQLTDVNSRLVSDPNNQELLELRANLIEREGVWRENLELAQRESEAIEARIDKLRHELTEAQQELPILEQRRAELMETLDVDSEELRANMRQIVRLQELDTQLPEVWRRIEDPGPLVFRFDKLPADLTRVGAIVASELYSWKSLFPWRSPFGRTFHLQLCSTSERVYYSSGRRETYHNEYTESFDVTGSLPGKVTIRGLDLDDDGVFHSYRKNSGDEWTRIHGQITLERIEYTREAVIYPYDGVEETTVTNCGS